MIQKARKAQAAVRAGGFAFGKVFSVCPLNWGAAPEQGPEIVDRAVKPCEVPALRAELARSFGLGGAHPQLLVRIG